MKASVASSAGNVEMTKMELNEQGVSRVQHISGRHTPCIFSPVKENMWEH